MRREELYNRCQFLNKRFFEEHYEDILKYTDEELEETAEKLEDFLIQDGKKKELKKYYEKFNVKKERLQKNIIFHMKRMKEAIERGQTESAIYYGQKTIKYLNKYKLKFESENYILDKEYYDEEAF